MQFLLLLRWLLFNFIWTIISTQLFLPEHTAHCEIYWQDTDPEFPNRATLQVFILCIPFSYYKNGTCCSTNATRVVCSNWIVWWAGMHQRWCGYVLVVWCLLHNKVIKITTESGCGWCHCAPLLQHFHKLDYRCQTWMCPVAPRWPQGFNQPRGRPGSRQQWQIVLCQLPTFCLKLYHYCSATTLIPHCEFDTIRFQLNFFILQMIWLWKLQRTNMSGQLDWILSKLVLSYYAEKLPQYTFSASTRH